MIKQTSYTADLSILANVIDNIPVGSINSPTGRFFYDKWVISDEYQGTVWQTILDSLPVQVGEARIIQLDPATCYHMHADIDDRYHLNLTGEDCYLVDIDDEKLYKIVNDGCWYKMNAGPAHSAINFGRYPRLQLVVRELLTAAELIDPVTVTILFDDLAPDDARYIFDNTYSKWLNTANKNKSLNEFSFNKTMVSFKTERRLVDTLPHVENFKVDIS